VTRPVRLVLASASPARRATLQRAGVVPEVVVSDVDEDALTAAADELSTAQLVERLATAKARAVAAQTSGDALVLGCDSMLELDGHALGKPQTFDVAVERWRAMRGKNGVLHTGHCLIDVASAREQAETVSTTVRFADLTDAEIDSYCRTGEPLRVAGAFTIDGLGGAFVTRIEGDHHNVVGLSLPLLRDLLGDAGIGWFDVAGPPLP
jgi:septum formation protein